MQAATPGAWINCRAEFLRKTRSLRFMRADVYAGDKHIASASGVWKAIGE